MRTILSVLGSWVSLNYDTLMEDFFKWSTVLITWSCFVSRKALTFLICKGKFQKKQSGILTKTAIFGGENEQRDLLKRLFLSFALKIGLKYNKDFQNKD